MRLSLFLEFILIWLHICICCLFLFLLIQGFCESLSFKCVGNTHESFADHLFLRRNGASPIVHFYNLTFKLMKFPSRIVSTIKMNYILYIGRLQEKNTIFLIFFLNLFKTFWILVFQALWKHKIWTSSRLIVLYKYLQNLKWNFVKNS